MKNTYITTDTHFNHELLTRLCKRPEDYEAQIIKGFEILKAEDTLIHLGDICMGDVKGVHEKIIQKIPCKKATMTIRVTIGIWITVGTLFVIGLTQSCTDTKLLSHINLYLGMGNLMLTYTVIYMTFHIGQIRQTLSML